MTALAFGLVFAASLLHATWNYLAKRASQGALFVWIASIVSSIMLLPFAVALIILQRPQLGGIELAFMSGTAVIHLGYLLSLQKGFRTGDFSIVYPVARGTGPVLTAIFAILLLGERPSVLAMTGIALVAGGVFTLAASSRQTHARNPREGLIHGLTTGLFIATYTLWDKFAVSVILVAPILLDFFSHFGRAVLLAPYAMRRWPDVTATWRSYRVEAVGVGVLSPTAYILVLTAMTFTPISYVAPVREMSILIGALIGARLLAEGDLTRRLTGAAAIVAGVVSLVIG